MSILKNPRYLHPTLKRFFYHINSLDISKLFLYSQVKWTKQQQSVVSTVSLFVVFLLFNFISLFCEIPANRQFYCQLSIVKTENTFLPRQFLFPSLKFNCELWLVQKVCRQIQTMHLNLYDQLYLSFGAMFPRSVPKKQLFADSQRRRGKCAGKIITFEPVHAATTS